MKHCLIIDQGPIPKIIKYDSLRNAYEKLLKMDMLFFFKKHPDKGVENNEYYIIFKDCIELTTYIPVELYFQYICGYVVSAYSSSLVTASMFPDIIAISLLNIVEWYDESFKKDVKAMLLRRSDDKILFPKDMKVNLY